MDKKKIINYFTILFGGLTIIFGILVVVNPTPIRVVFNMIVFMIFNIFLGLKQKYIIGNNKSAMVFFVLAIFLLVPLITNIYVYMLR